MPHEIHAVVQNTDNLDLVAHLPEEDVVPSVLSTAIAGYKMVGRNAGGRTLSQSLKLREYRGQVSITLRQAPTTRRMPTDLGQVAAC
jgi:hypothetical protein